jgi:hypothetical protein
VRYENLADLALTEHPREYVRTYNYITLKITMEAVMYTNITQRETEVR